MPFAGGQAGQQSSGHVQGTQRRMPPRMGIPELRFLRWVPMAPRLNDRLLADLDILKRFAMRTSMRLCLDTTPATAGRWCQLA